MLISTNQFDNQILVLKPICDAVRRYEIEQMRHYHNHFNVESYYIRASSHLMRSTNLTML